MSFRIEVFRSPDGADLFGSVVHLAARITDRAAPGQVVVSNVVRELCAGKDLVFEPLEDVALKGFSGRIALFLAGPAIAIGSESES